MLPGALAALQCPPLREEGLGHCCDKVAKYDVAVAPAVGAPPPSAAPAVRRRVTAAPPAFSAAMPPPAGVVAPAGFRLPTPANGRDFSHVVRYGPRSALGTVVVHAASHGPAGSCYARAKAFRTARPV